LLTGTFLVILAPDVVVIVVVVVGETVFLFAGVAVGLLVVVLGVDGASRM